MSKGLIFVISGPSGAGKSTLCYQLAKKTPNIRCSISCTTRPRRTGEKHGRDYFFLSKHEFEKIIHKNGFVEWAQVHGYFYGTPKDFVEKTINSGKDIFLNIDVQGGMKISKVYKNSILVFVMTPSLTELENRLRDRGKDSEESINRRLKDAKTEIQCIKNYHYLIINDSVPRAAKDLGAIVIAEHRKVVKNYRGLNVFS